MGSIPSVVLWGFFLPTEVVLGIQLSPFIKGMRFSPLVMQDPKDSPFSFFLEALHRVF
jgi:hypothetical protein